MKSQLFGEFPNLSNMNSDFTSETTVRNIEIPSSIFVVSEQVLDVSAQANIQHAATKITNMADGVHWIHLHLPNEWNSNSHLFHIMFVDNFSFESLQ